MEKVILKKIVKIKTGKLDANASEDNGIYPFFTCAREISRINVFAFDCECVLVAGNGELNVKYYIGKFNAYQRTYVIESINKSVLSVKYLFYFIDSYIETLRNGAIGGVIKYIKLNHLTDIEIPLPDLETQNKIVAILDKAKAILDKREQTIQMYDELLRAIFLEMFGDVANNPKKIDTKPLKEFGEIITGNTPPRSDASNYDSKYIEWIKTDNILSESHILSPAAEYLSETGFSRARYVNANSLLVACIAGSIGSIGRSAISNRKVAFNQQINAIVPANNVSIYFLYWMFKISAEYIQSFATGGMKRLLTKGEFEKIPFIKPNYQEQLKFEKIAIYYSYFKSKVIAHQVQSEKLLNSLTQQVFSERIIIDVDAELEALINVIDLEKKDEENKIDTITNDITFVQRLIDRLSEQEFEDKHQYDKAKYILFRIMKDDDGFVKQVFQKEKEEVQLTL